MIYSRIPDSRLKTRISKTDFISFRNKSLRALESEAVQYKENKCVHPSTKCFL